MKILLTIFITLIISSSPLSAQALDLVDKDGNVVANSTTSIEEINALADGVYKFEQPQKTITIDKPSIEVVNTDGVVVADGNATLGEFILLPGGIYTIKTYIPITISSVVVENNEVTLTWTAPTQNTDNSPLTDLAGFEIYYWSSVDSTQTVVTINDPTVQQWKIEGLVNGDYFFAVAAFNLNGAGSKLSNIATKLIN